MTDAEFIQALNDADRLVASWPAWKRGILAASGSPTVKRREVKEKAMSGISDEVVKQCDRAYVEKYLGTNETDRKKGIRAVLEKYRELTGATITAEQARLTAAAVRRFEGLDEYWQQFADQLNELASRPAPAVVVPEDVREAACLVAEKGAAKGWMPESVTMAEWIKSLIPTPPKPEPGQRAWEAYIKAVEGLDIDDNCVPWCDLLPVDHQCWAAVEAALKGDADGPAN